MGLERILLSVGPDDYDHLDGLVDSTADVAESTDATVYVLYAFPQDEYDELLDRMDAGRKSGGLTPDEVAARHDSVRIPADRFEALGIDFEIRGVGGGDPVTQVVRKVDELDADVVVVGGAERSPAGKAVFGDYAQQVLLDAPCPVLYVKRE